MYQRLEVKRTSSTPIRNRLLSTLLTYLPGAWIDPRDQELISLYRLRYKMAMEEKKFDTGRIRQAFDAVKGYDAMIGRISFSPDNHCALTGDQRVMATLSSGRDPRSLGVFRERA